MPKLTAPLLSLRASGSIGKTITYLSHTNKQYARGYVKARFSRTETQENMRFLMSDASEAWRLNLGIIDADYKLYFDNLAIGLCMSGFNLYMREAIKYNGGSAFIRPFIPPPIGTAPLTGWVLPFVFGS